jgi:hypothetical protein
VPLLSEWVGQVGWPNEKAKRLHARGIEFLQVVFSPVDESLLGGWPPNCEHLGSG